MAHPSIFDPPVNGVVIPKGSAQAPTARRADPLTAIARQQRAAWIDPLDVDFTDRYKIGTPELEEARKIAATLRVRLKSELANPISSLILMKPPAQKEWLDKFYE